MNAREAFRELGLEPSASPLQVRAAYLARARTEHPDAGGDPALFAFLAEAYRVATERARSTSRADCAACQGTGKVLSGKGWGRRADPCAVCGGDGKI